MLLDHPSLRRVSCDLLPYGWRIIPRNNQGVTVCDVLEAMHNVFRASLTIPEWEGWPHKDRERIKRVFDRRWKNPVSPDKEKKGGLKRVD